MNPFSLSTIRYAELCIEIHNLILENKRDGICWAHLNDPLDDEADNCWQTMTEAEQALMRILSADLYNLVEKEALWDPEIPGHNLQASILLQSERWGPLLSLLRYKGDTADLQRAVWQATAWKHLGCMSAAKVFLDHAEKLRADETSLEKKRRLEKKGWYSGSAEDFLNSASSNK